MEFVWRYGSQVPKRAAGRVDEVRVSDQTATFEGWMLSPEGDFGPPFLYINGEPMGSASRRPRPDVGKSHPWLPHSDRSGWSATVPRAAIGNVASLELVLGDPASPAAYLSTVAVTEPDTAFSSPPLALMHQIGSPDAHSYIAQGNKLFADFTQAIGADRLRRTGLKLLDWGCGCGRISAMFLRYRPEVQVTGVDIADNCVQWCRKNLAGGRFLTTGLYPPLPFPDGAFDVVLASSVMTHLKREAQGQWLREMRRILAPGGLLLASVLGRYAYQRQSATAGRSLLEKVKTGFARRRIARELDRTGIHDAAPNRSLKGRVPDGYYMNVFQTEEYTLRQWGGCLTVAKYIERGLDNYQDLVVLTHP